jgi:hypothetical protein
MAFKRERKCKSCNVTKDKCVHFSIILFLTIYKCNQITFFTHTSHNISKLSKCKQVTFFTHTLPNSLFSIQMGSCFSSPSTLEVGARYYQCDQCEKILKSQRSLESHRKKHKGKYLCHKCKQVYQSAVDRDGHMT